METKCLNPGCKKTFSPKTKRATYCSQKCKVSHSRLLKKGGKKKEPIVALVSKGDGPKKPLDEVLPKSQKTGVVDQDKSLLGALEKRFADAGLKVETTSDIINKKMWMPAWATKIENFCAKHEITPDDLMDSYVNKAMGKETKKETKSAGPVKSYMEMRREMKNGKEG
jgi:hypothetical protein